VPVTREPIVIDHVTLRHPGWTTPAVVALDATIPARGVTVVSGPSGCGKSTLLAAVAGLLEPAEGSLTVGGTATSGTAWQCRVAWVPQRPQFVAGTVADHLRVADPSASDERLWAALRTVALEERVRCLPGALASPLTEDAASLSAGERARLSLARVVVADRPWVLLDEPTAHLDELSEQVIADVVVDLARTRAIVVVSHRPAMLALADHAIVLASPAAVPTAAPAIASLPASARPRPPTGPTGPVEVLPVEPPVPQAPAGFLLSTVLGSLSSASGVALTATAGWLIVQASTRPAVLTLLVAVVGVRLFGLARPVLRYAERLRSHDAALALLALRRVQVYDALVPLTPARLGRRRGDMLTAVVDDVDSTVDRELRVRLPVRTAVGVTVLASAVAALLLPVVGLIVGVSSALAGLGGFLVSGAGAARAERQAVRLRAALSIAIVETVQAADELRVWQATDDAAARIADISDDLGAQTRSAATWVGTARAWVLLVSGAAVGTTAAVTAGPVSAGTLSAPLAALLVLLPLALADVLLPLADAGATAVRTAAAEHRLTALERTAPAVRDTVCRPATTAYDLGVTEARTRWQPGAPLTAPVSLEVAAGARIGIVGPSGCGKSTLAALLMRFLDPVSGRVMLGGVDTRDLALDDVRRVVGLVDDDPHVFASTLVENVRLARPEASDAEVEGALRAARLGAWLDSLPDGLHTWLGDGHAQVSVGERSRIAIARSVLSDQPVLVLDEPAAHLDVATAGELASELLTGPRIRSVVWITHSPVGLDLVDTVHDLGAPLGTDSPTTRRA
jgi:ATP-binding cassette, subfamily C, bacterial CydCD